MKPENIKCGEIFRYAPGKYTFTCSHCSESFTTKSAALSHFESHFIVEFTTKLEVDFDIEEKSEVASVADSFERDDIQSWEADIKQEETVEGSCENAFLLDETLNKDYCDCEQTSVQTTSKSTFPNTINDSVEHRLNLKTHLKWGPTYTRKTLFDCDICGKQMVRSNLKKHFLAHLNQKEYVCTVCKRGFNNKNQLRRHSLTHSITKRFNCDHCGWQFHDRTNLLVHIRKHTGEKPYKCQICDKSFSQASSLKTHIRIHTGDKPYKCQLCSRAFASSSAFRMHEKRHNNHRPHQCKLCENKSFATSTDLKKHIQSVHTGERPYVCQVCNLSYSNRDHYNQHVLLHTGEKKYKCRACDLSFVQSAPRRLHERSAHKDVAHLLAFT